VPPDDLRQEAARRASEAVAATNLPPENQLATARNLDAALQRLKARRRQPKTR
jgi:hypothetical protein